MSYKILDERDIDLKYSPNSENAQSGKAVSQAVSEIADQNSIQDRKIQALEDSQANFVAQQTYDPESPLAQSGKAVAEAVNKGKLKLIKSITTEEVVTKITTTFEKPLKEFWVRFIGALDIAEKVTNCILASRCDSGSQYFVYCTSQTFEPNQKKAFTFHAKEIVPFNWESEFGKLSIGGSETQSGFLLQGLSAHSADLRKSYSTRTHLAQQYVSNLDFFVYNGTYSFATGSYLEIWGVEVDE